MLGAAAGAPSWWAAGRQLTGPGPPMRNAAPVRPGTALSATGPRAIARLDGGPSPLQTPEDEQGMIRALLQRAFPKPPGGATPVTAAELPEEQGYYNSFVLPRPEGATPRALHFSREYESRTLAEDRELLERI